VDTFIGKKYQRKKKGIVATAEEPKDSFGFVSFSFGCNSGSVCYMETLYHCKGCGSLRLISGKDNPLCAQSL